MREITALLERDHGALGTVVIGRVRKAIYYSAVCVETGEVEWMELEGNSNAGISAAFLMQLRQRHVGR